MRNFFFRESDQNQIEHSTFCLGEGHAIWIGRGPFKDIAHTASFEISAISLLERVRTLEEKLDAAKKHPLARLNLRRVDAFALNVGSVAALQVTDGDGRVADLEFGMDARNRRIRQDDLAGRVPSDLGRSFEQLDRWGKRKVRPKNDLRV